MFKKAKSVELKINRALAHMGCLPGAVLDIFGSLSIVLLSALSQFLKYPLPIISAGVVIF